MARLERRAILAQRCPVCGQGPGVPCTVPVGIPRRDGGPDAPASLVLRSTHGPRRDAARRALLKPSPELARERRDFCSDLALLKAKAGQLGLFRTMHKLDLATTEVGYEVARLEEGRR